jgi:hypothetical protein
MRYKVLVWLPWTAAVEQVTPGSCWAGQTPELQANAPETIFVSEVTASLWKNACND